MAPMFPPGAPGGAAAAAGFYVPTMPQPRPAYYPNSMQQVRPQPRWPTQQVRGPAQPGTYVKKSSKLSSSLTTVIICISNFAAVL